MTHKLAIPESFIGLKWKNLAFSKQLGNKELCGVDFNCLLMGMFILFSKSDDIPLPGAHSAWMDIVEPTFICLNHILSVGDLVGLIFELYSNNNQMIRLFSGSLHFLWFWIDQYPNFIDFKEKIRLHAHLLAIRSTIISSLESSNGQFVEQIDRVVERLKRTTVIGTMHLLEPNCSVCHGSWDGTTSLTAKERSALLKSEMSKMPKVKLELFGADTLLDDDSNEDDESVESEASQVIVKFPVPRVRTGVDLLSPVNDLLEIDLEELARQWTLVDHALFCSLPLMELLNGCFESQVTTHDRRDKIYDAVKSTVTRKLVDRFNAASLWVTETIIFGDTPTRRAELLTKFISLAEELQKLHNYHGLMVILTAVQQGCISRMTQTMALLTTETVAILQRLKKLMDGAKNYISYREELGRIVSIISPEKEEAMRGWKYYITGEIASILPCTNESLRQEDAVEAVVPHLAAHLGAITGITECHEDYLPENVHLMNLTKWKLFAAIVLPLHLLQRLRYRFLPVRAISTALNLEWNRLFHESTYRGVDVAARLFSLSENRESNRQLIQRLQSMEGKRQLNESDITTKSGPIAPSESSVSTAPPSRKLLQKKSSLLFINSFFFRKKSDDLVEEDEESVSNASDDENGYPSSDNEEEEETNRVMQRPSLSRKTSMLSSILPKVWK